MLSVVLEEFNETKTRHKETEAALTSVSYCCHWGTDQ